MSSIICRNRGNLHHHQSVYDSKICWGVIAPPTPPPPPVSVGQPCTMRQLDYIRTLGGDTTYAAKLSKVEASAYIDRLKANPPAARSTVNQPAKPPPDPRLDLIKGMIDLIPHGYYAVRADDNAPITFLRISRPKVGSRNQYAGSTKIQSQHGPRLELSMVLWPSGSWSIYEHSMVDSMMLLLPDHQTAAKRYAYEIGRCMRCNAELTDDRSRFYGIGPECEGKVGWGWVVDSIDDERSGSFEHWRRLGQLSRFIKMQSA